jgi:membrane protein
MGTTRAAVPFLTSQLDRGSPAMNRKRDLQHRDSGRLYRIPLKGWRQVGHRMWSKSRHDHLTVVAAGCAFYAFFAIFPALSAVISIYGLTADPAAAEQTFAILTAVLPQQAYDIVIEQIRRIAESSNEVLGWHLVLSLALALWSTNAGVQAMFAALNIAYGERERRNLLEYYASALTFSIAGMAGGLIMLLAIVYVPLLFAFAGFSMELELIVRIGRWPFLALLILLLLELLYRYGPCRRNAKWHWVSIGSLFATALWLIATAAFSLYVTNIANYSRTYGSLGAVIVLLFWLYICFYIALLGAEINAVLELKEHGT